MTDSLSLHNIYVEGNDDIKILSRWFPRLQFVKARGKDSVKSKVEGDINSFGLLDRDFATEEDVAASREPGSRLAIMQRYCIENYLLEPSIIATAIRDLAGHPPDWLEETHIRRSLEEWASEVTLYAAANSIISEWRDRIQYDQKLGFLHYSGPLPPISRAEVVESLRRRLAALTPADQIEMLLDARHAQVSADIMEWASPLDQRQGLVGEVLLPACFRARRSLSITGARPADRSRPASRSSRASRISPALDGLSCGRSQTYHGDLVLEYHCDRTTETEVIEKTNGSVVRRR
jgi:hypothetical protein